MTTEELMIKYNTLASKFYNLPRNYLQNKWVKYPKLHMQATLLAKHVLKIQFFSLKEQRLILEDNLGWISLLRIQAETQAFATQ